MKTYNITVIGGDGIGPEVIHETVRLLQSIPLHFNFTYADAGYVAYKKFGLALPSKTVKLAKSSDAILFGAVTTPPHVANYKSPIVQLRKTLELYANVRPFFSLPIASIRPNIDIILLRENTEDLYLGRERLTSDGAIAERVITKKASKNIIDYAFLLAIRLKRKKVTVVHKANILRLTDGLFLSIAHTVSKKYPSIVMEDMLVDSCAMQLVKNPERFDVIVTTNMFGDILSDEIAGFIGGLGVAASANNGKKNALFEPVHGSAPKYKGTNTANPLATLYASCLMLDYLNEKKWADRIRKSLTKLMKNGTTTKDLGGSETTTGFTDKLIEQLKNNL